MTTNTMQQPNECLKLLFSASIQKQRTFSFPQAEEDDIEPCDICGDIGYPEVIARCIKCKIFCEHCYCMRNYTYEFPVYWICESCQTKNGTTSQCKVDWGLAAQAPKRKAPVAKAKVKYIPEDEVIKLSSGSFPAKPFPEKSTLLMKRKASLKSQNVISKIPSMAPNSNPRPIVHEKLPRNGGVTKNAVTDQHASCPLSKRPIKEHIQEHRQLLGRQVHDKEHIQEHRQLLGRQVHDREVQTLDLQKEKPTERAPCESLSIKKFVPSVGSGGIICSDADCNKIEKGDTQSIQENLNLLRKFLPASTAAWSGCFAASGKCYGGFEAHPPCTVNIKAYNFSRRMPPVLQLESFHSLDCYTDVFQDDSPTLQDIALYFFPSNDMKRSKDDLNSIFEFMNAKNSMLRSSIDGVELLVFTSNQLHMQSRGTIAALHVGCFLWGVFRQSKTDKAAETLPCNYGDDVDMDVDMIGGKDVSGKTDHVVNDKSRSVSQTHLHSSSEKVEKKPLIRPPLVIHFGKKIKKLPPGSSSLEFVENHSSPLDKLDPPPGFEAHSKNRSSKFPVHVKEPVENGGRSVSNGACLGGLSGRGSVQPLKFNRN